MKKLDVGNLKIESLCGKGYKIIEAYSVPTTCSSVSKQTIKLAIDKYPKLNGLFLADRSFSTSEKEIDILIGANFYWDFTAGKSMRIDDGLVAVDTILGWVVLSGSFNPSHKDLTSINCISAHVLQVECKQNFPHNTLINNLERFREVECDNVTENKGIRF